MPIDHAKLPVSDLGVARGFYAAALAPLGGRLVTDAAPADVHFAAGDGGEVGAPGERPYGPAYYAAFVTDPDGHNLEAVSKGPSRDRNGCKIE